jgi:hypothetical protein
VLSVLVNGGEPLVLGPRQVKEFPVVVTAVDDSGIQSVTVNPVGAARALGTLARGDHSCRSVDETTVSCTSMFTADTRPDSGRLVDLDAGDWIVDLVVQAVDGDCLRQPDAAGSG